MSTRQSLMKKINIVKENREYSRLIKTAKRIYTKNFTVFIEYQELEHYQFGFSVSKKIGNAVTRNKIKRQLKSILDKKNYENTFSCIIMVKRGILELSYEEMEKELLGIVQKLKIIKGESNEKEF